MTEDISQIVRELQGLNAYTPTPEAKGAMNWKAGRATLTRAIAALERVSAENAELKMQAIADTGQAQSAYEAQLAAEARLTEAVEVLRVLADGTFNAGLTADNTEPFRVASAFLRSVGEHK